MLDSLSPIPFLAGLQVSCIHQIIVYPGKQIGTASCKLSDELHIPLLLPSDYCCRVPFYLRTVKLLDPKKRTIKAWASFVHTIRLLLYGAFAYLQAVRSLKARHGRSSKVLLKGNPLGSQLP